MGATNVLAKPFSNADLTATISEVLAGAGAAVPAPASG